MAALVENVEKVKAAHGAIKDALVAKGVAVPEGAKLTDMPALVESIEAATPNLSVWAANQIYAGDLVVPKIVIVDTTRLPSLSYCFDSCYNLTSLTLPDGFGGAATDLSYCFDSCYSLTSLTLPDGFGGAATLVTYCFSSCFNLTTLNRAPAFTISWGIDFSPLTHESLVNICTTLVDLTALATPKTATLTLGTANLNKLTDEEKAVATEKGWTLA